MISIKDYTLVTVAEGGPPLASRIQDLIDSVWPRHVQEAQSTGYSSFSPDWMGIYQRHPQFQFALFGKDDDQQATILAAGNAVPLFWDTPLPDLPDTGWDWVLHTAQADHEDERQPTLLSAVSATVAPAQRRKGLSRVVIQGMRALAQEAGFPTLIAPVRPILKRRYPLVPMSVYATWTDADGLPFDPWIRTHARLGATVSHPCDLSMVMGGSVGDWTRWLDLPMLSSGLYTHPSLLAPLNVNVEADRGIYVEPNLWMVHELG